MAKGRSGNKKSAGQQAENKRIYSNPLPVSFPNLPAYPRLTLGLLGLSNFIIDNPHCLGVLDSDTQSIWVLNPKDSLVLWRRGFYGKGNLSRSEPSWLARQQQGNKTAEEITAQRRIARRKFKLERARAMVEAAEAAEAAFAGGEESNTTNSLPNLPQRSAEPEMAFVPPSDSSSDEDPLEITPEEDREHLQLTLQEAFFLSWNLDCLAICDRDTEAPLSLQQLWRTFQAVSCPYPFVPRPDNPFVVQYVVYHHFRSLGWVVRGGLKFCVDYLLYKKGPVFSHAEFALVICPSYEDPADQASAPYQIPNSEPFTWSWLSTLNRVNSQVQKSLILVYVTIPSSKSLTPDLLCSPACLSKYSVREVTLRRFIPARMRD